MVGSSFILINKNGRRTLLNTAQVTYVAHEDVRLTARNRRFYRGVLPTQEMAHTIEVEFTDSRPKAYFYDNAEERDQVLDQLIAALAPSLVIDSPPGLPLTWSEIERQVPEPTDSLDGLSLDEVRSLAMAQLKHLHEQAAPTAASTAPSAPPAAKPSRKSR